MVQISSSIILNIRQTVDLFAKHFHTVFPLGLSLSENKLVKLTFLISLWDLREARLSANTQWKETISAKLSGFKRSSLRPHLGQETLTWRTIQRRGRNCVLKNFPDNIVLTVCHFSFFYFPFYFSRPDIEGFFFSGPNFPLCLPLLLAPGSVHQSSSAAQMYTEFACT